MLGTKPWAINPPMMPLRTSPVPPVAIPGLANDATLTAPSGWPINVLAPFSTKVTFHFVAYSRVTAIRSF